MTAEEVAAVDLLGVEWAVLSACESGLGDVQTGEGVFGLRRAFAAAGARTLIMSLWPVDDDVTRDWMTRLYHIGSWVAQRRSRPCSGEPRSSGTPGAKRGKHPSLLLGRVCGCRGLAMIAHQPET